MAADNRSATDTQTSNTLLDAALGYRDADLPIFPLCSPAWGPHTHYDPSTKKQVECPEKSWGKHPLVKWRQFQTKLPTEEQVRGWYRRWPDANIGLATGHLAGLVVGDFDGHVAVQEARRRGLPKTAFTHTGKPGGEHHYFAWSDDAPRNFAGAVGGIDYRGEGGYVVLPPSLHYLGPHYAWGSPLVADLPELPPWFAELKNERRASAAADDGKHYQGARNAALTSEAGRLVNAGLHGTVLLAALVAWDREHCVPPLGEVEVAVTADSADRNFEQHAGSPDMGSGGARSRRAQPEDDEEPEREYRPPMPDFDLRYAPLTMADMARGSTLPDAFQMGAGLVAGATAIGDRARLAILPTWLVGAHVWVPLVGLASDGKSPTIDLMTAPLRSLNATLLEEDAAEYKRWQEDDPATRGSEPTPRDFLELGTITIEALYVELYHTGARALINDELDILLSTLVKYGNNDAGGLGDLLALWTGGPTTFKRRAGAKSKNGLRLYIPRPNVNILGALVRGDTGKLGATLSGMRPRWLPFVDLKNPPPYRDPSKDVLEAWAGALFAIRKRTLERTWVFGPAAYARFVHHADRWEERKSRPGQGASVVAACGKADTHLGRITLILAELEPGLYEHARKTNDWTVPPEIVDRAAYWVDFTLDCWDYLGESMTVAFSRGDQTADPAVDQIEQWIERHGHEDEVGRWLAHTELYSSKVGGLRTRADLRRALVRYKDRNEGTVEQTIGRNGKETYKVYAPFRRKNGGPLPDESGPLPDESGPLPDESGPLDPPNGPPESPTDHDSRARPREDEPETAPVGVVAEPVVEPEELSENGTAPARARDAPPRTPARARVKSTPADGPKLYPDASYTRVESAPALNKAMLWLAEADTIGFDTETTGLRPQRDEVRLLQLAGEVGGMRRTFVADVWKCGDWPSMLDNLFRHDEITFVGMEMPFDLGMIEPLAITPPARMFDVRIAAYVTEQSGAPGRSYDLRTIVRQHLERTLVKELQGSDWSPPVLTDQQWQYAANDAAVLLDLHRVLNVLVLKHDRQKILDLEMSLTAPMTWLREAGLPLDVDLWRVRTLEATLAYSAKLAEIHHLAGTVPEEHKGGKSASKKSREARQANEHNWGSAPQNLVWFNAHGVKVDKADKQALIALHHPVGDALLEWRALGRRAVYGQKLLDKALLGDRAYGSFTQLGTATGRMSCREPNLQQMNRGRHYREAVRAPDGYTLVKCDYSALQMRIAAEISGDPTLIALFEAGGDPHTNTTVEVLHASPDDDVARVTAKGVNFGFLFGAGPATARTTIRTGYGVDLDLETVKQYRERFFQTYPGLKAWHNQWEHAVREAPLDVPDPSGSGRWRMKVLKYTERINTPVQMVEAHGVKLALRRLFEEREAWPDVRLVMIAHDEFVAEVPLGIADDYGAYLAEVMRSCMQDLLHSVPVKVDLTISPTWWKDKAVAADTLLSELYDEEEI